MANNLGEEDNAEIPSTFDLNLNHQQQLLDFHPKENPMASSVSAGVIDDSAFVPETPSTSPKNNNKIIPSSSSSASLTPSRTVRERVTREVETTFSSWGNRKSRKPRHATATMAPPNTPTLPVIDPSPGKEKKCPDAPKKDKTKYARVQAKKKLNFDSAKKELRPTVDANMMDAATSDGEEEEEEEYTANNTKESLQKKKKEEDEEYIDTQSLMSETRRIWGSITDLYTENEEIATKRKKIEKKYDEEMPPTQKFYQPGHGLPTRTETSFLDRKKETWMEPPNSLNYRMPSADLESYDIPKTSTLHSSLPNCASCNVNKAITATVNCGHVVWCIACSRLCPLVCKECGSSVTRIIPLLNLSNFQKEFSASC